MIPHRKHSASILSIILVFIFLTNSVAFGQQTQKRDYYEVGQIAAQHDYKGGGLLLGGFTGGCLFSLLGWAFAYVLVSDQEIEVPRKYLSGLSESEVLLFEKGYKAWIIKTKKNEVNIGAGLGTAVGIFVLLITNV
jgi:hypothetical protein